MNDPDPDPPDPPGASRLEELIVQALERLEEGGREELERFLASCPERAPRVRSALAALAARGLAGSQPAATAAEPFPERLGGFELIRPLGGGGMGVVYLAREEGLEREVALKLVRPDQLHFPGARERFRREMRTVASLQHPGIVPLFAVGEERGLPFYAMELVRGVTLAAVVRRLAGRDPATLRGADLRAVLVEEGEPAERGERPELPELFRGRWEEVALRIARRLADALEHAHRRGVVHRDVKPSNVMLAADGRVQLVDFGLSSQRGDTRITRSGSPLGSLAYMAPEMLRGEAPEDDPRLDVYSLGVTLCELATLRLPFPSESEARLRQAVLAGRAPSVRAALPSASWELETLVAVACDPDPARRYPSMAAFARDLDNALRRIPLEARPPGRALRARRWVQRHPVAALAGFALAVGPSLLALQEIRNTRIVLAKSDEIAAQSAQIQAQSETLADQNRALSAALAAEEAERARAERNLDKALEAVDRMLTRVGDQELADVPHFEQVRRRLLEDALAFYGWFLEREERGEVLVEYVHSVVRAAHLNAVLGRPERGIRLLEETEDKLAAAGGAERFPAATIWLRSERASLVLTAEGDRAGAARLLDGCDRLLEQSGLDADDPQRLVLAGQLASERALLERARGDIGAALVSNERAVEAFSDLPADVLPLTSRRAFDVPENLLRALDLRAALMEMRVADLPPDEVRPWRERSIPVLDRAAELARAALADEPESVTHRALLVRILSNRAACCLNLGHNDQAIASAREACAIGRPLVRDFPSVEDFAKDTTTAAAMLAGLLADAGEVQEAEDPGTWAVAELAARGAERSTTPWMRGSYGTALGNLAIVRWQQGRVEDCLALHRRAVEQFDEAVRLAPGVGFFEEARRQSIARQAGSLLALARHDEAFLLVHELYERTGGAADLLLLARTGALCVTSLETAEPDPARRAELAEAYAALVADELRPALQARTLTPDQLTALDLDALRGCSAFAEVP